MFLTYATMTFNMVDDLNVAGMKIKLVASCITHSHTGGCNLHFSSDWIVFYSWADRAPFEMVMWVCFGCFFPELVPFKHGVSNYAAIVTLEDAEAELVLIWSWSRCNGLGSWPYLVIDILIFDSQVKVQHPLPIIILLLVYIGVLAEIGYAVPLRLALLLTWIQLCLEAVLLRVSHLIGALDHALWKSLEIVITIIISINLHPR